MRLLQLSVFLCAFYALPASAEQCAQGVPGLASVASKLKVRNTGVFTPSSLMDCQGRTYEIGSLLGAAVERIEKAEADAAEALRQIKRTGLDKIPTTSSKCLEQTGGCITLTPTETKP